MAYQKTVLGNGIPIVSDTLPESRSVSLGLWVNAGSRDEAGEENGVSHFIEHMVFKGTRNRDTLRIAKELDAIGGLSNAFTGKENTCFHARVLKKDFGKLVEILSDIFLNSMFSHPELETERQVILREIAMLEDCPDDHVHELFSQLFWSDHPIGMPVLGTEETVSTMQRNTLVTYVERFYVPGRIVVAAAGNVEHEPLVAAVLPWFETLAGENPPVNGPAPRANAAYRAYVKDLEQVQICLGGEAPGHCGEGRFAAALFNTILGGNMSSRLFQEIRENRGLAYAVYSFLSPYRDTGLLGVYAATEARNVNPVIETVRAEIEGIARGRLLESDLRAAKDHVAGGIFLSSESTDSRMMRLARNEFIFGRYLSPEDIVNRLEQVTAEEVIGIAGEIFRTERTSLVTLGPFGEEELEKGLFPFH